MKLVYVIAQSHTGSTLLDCILSQHPDFQSTGEFKHLGWQLYRSIETKGSIEEGSACSCGQDFRDCTLWSKVIDALYESTGVNLADDPYALDLYFFDQKSYGGLGNQRRSVTGLFQGRLARTLLELGVGHKLISVLIPRINVWLTNAWKVYTTLSRVSDRRFVVDSSKDRTLALLHKSFQPEDVEIIFLHRSINGIVSSAKRVAKKNGIAFDINNIFAQKKEFERTVSHYKQIIGSQSYTDIEYEDLVRYPTTFINQVARKLGSNVQVETPNHLFFIDPRNSHIVAGNPMRYRGKQQVLVDNRWKSDLTDTEKRLISQAFPTAEVPIDS